MDCQRIFPLLFFSLSNFQSYEANISEILSFQDKV